MAKQIYYQNDGYQQAFASLADGLPGVPELRARAFADFMATGFPTQKVEEWKYSGLSALANAVFVPVKTTDRHAEAESFLAQSVPLEGAVQLVFVDGHFNTALSQAGDLEDGVTLTSLASALAAGDNRLEGRLKTNEQAQGRGLRSVNAALMTDGFVLEVAADTTVSRPIQVTYISTSAVVGHSTQLRNVISLGKNSQLRLLEQHIGVDTGTYWSNFVTDCTLGEDAVLERTVLQEEGAKAVYVAEGDVQLAARASLKAFWLTLGGQLSRQSQFLAFNGMEAEVALYGAYLGAEGQSHDMLTVMDHKVGHCNSDQIFRGVLDKGAKAAFQGRVIVAPDAQLTNANQANNNMLLDRSAEVNSKPELKIYADDVKCSHGSTVGELDKDMLFYLRSRGLDADAAEQLLVEAFIAEVLEEGLDAELLDFMQLRVRSWMASHTASPLTAEADGKERT